MTYGCQPKNRGILAPKWMVKTMENPIQGMIWGETTLFLETSIKKINTHIYIPDLYLEFYLLVMRCAIFPSWQITMKHQHHFFRRRLVHFLRNRQTSKN